MKHTKPVVILLVLLLAAMVVVPLVCAAEEQKAGDITLNTSAMKQLAGQDITVGQYYEKVSPELLATMPGSLREKLYRTKMKWPAPLSRQESTSRSNTAGTTAVSPFQVIYMALSQSGYGLVGSTVSYLSETYSSPSGTLFPYMSDTSTLFKWNFGTSQWDPVVARSHPGYLLSHNAASGIQSVSSGTYIVFGEHYGIFPLGSTPVDYIQYTESPIFTVS